MKTIMTKQQWVEIGTKAGWIRQARRDPNRQSPVLDLGWTRRQESPSKATYETELMETIHDAFATLSPEESSVISRLFGFQGEKMNENQIADDMGIGIDMVNELKSSGSAKIAEYFRKIGVEESFPIHQAL